MPPIPPADVQATWKQHGAVRMAGGLRAPPIMPPPPPMPPPIPVGCDADAISLIAQGTRRQTGFTFAHTRRDRAVHEGAIVTFPAPVPASLHPVDLLAGVDTDNLLAARADMDLLGGAAHLLPRRMRMGLVIDLISAVRTPKLGVVRDGAVLEGAVDALPVSMSASSEVNLLA